MTDPSHSSADASHYDEGAESYDVLNEENSRVINRVVDAILQKHHVKTVLDLTCGTGSQVFWLTERGYDVTGSDINAKMLGIAQAKAQDKQLDIMLLEGDMRNLSVGEFDAVITIFNAIGHLTQDDFEKAIRNIRENLKDGGLYIFDINNLAYLQHGDNITSLTIDWQKNSDDKTVRKIQYSTINRDGILASYTTSHVQVGDDQPEISESKQTLQVYSAQQLRYMLERNGFDVISHVGIDGSEFHEYTTECILTVARKRI